MHSDEPSLVRALRMGHLDAARKLIDEGVDVNEPDGNGMTPLMWAAFTRDLDLIERLLAAGAEVNAQSAGGTTALRCACSSSSPDVVRRLLAAGADPCVWGLLDEGPVLSACARSPDDEQAEILSLVLDAIVRSGRADSMRPVALHTLAGAGNARGVALFAEKMPPEIVRRHLNTVDRRGRMLEDTASEIDNDHRRRAVQAALKLVRARLDTPAQRPVGRKVPRYRRVPRPDAGKDRWSRYELKPWG